MAQNTEYESLAQEARRAALQRRQQAAIANGLQRSAEQEKAQEGGAAMSVEIPGLGRVEFAPGITPEAAQAALQKHFSGQGAGPTAPQAGAMGDQAQAQRIADLQRRQANARRQAEGGSEMTTFEFQGPDGKTYEVQAPSMEIAAQTMMDLTNRNQQTTAPGQSMTPDQLRALATARRRKAEAEAQQGVAPGQAGTSPEQRQAIARALAEVERRKAAGQWNPTPQTGMREQAMSGVNEGIAGILGAPVDLVNGAMNLGRQGINAIAGTDFQPVESPFGGSETMRELLGGTISDVQPQTAGQRYGRRIGQEVGAMSVPGGVMMRSARAPLTLAGGEVASAVGAGIGGQTSQEVAPGNATADAISAMIGGLSPVAASRALRPTPRAPTLDQLKAESSAGYDEVRASGATLSPQSADTLAAGIEGTMGKRAATRMLNPKAGIAADQLTQDLRRTPPTISDVDEIRQWIGQNVAGSNEAGERRLGGLMKDTIDGHLDGLQPSDVTGTNRAGDVVAALTQAREKARRVHKSNVFEAEDTGAFDRGLRRAATTGTGGNEINAIRQNVRRVLENPKLRRGFTESELQAMRDISDGTPTQNAMRLLGRLAPTSGALPLGGFAGAAGATGATGNPLFMVPAVLGQGAKYLGERSTKKQIGELGEMIRNGGTLPKKAASEMETGVVAALLASQSAQRPKPSEKNRRLIEAMLGLRSAAPAMP